MNWYAVVTLVGFLSLAQNTQAQVPETLNLQVANTQMNVSQQQFQLQRPNATPQLVVLIIGNILGVTSLGLFLGALLTDFSANAAFVSVPLALIGLIMVVGGGIHYAIKKKRQRDFDRQMLQMQRPAISFSGNGLAISF